jgi:ElaB/YqjD/DUF883 family membrane-anchored ribosome-binding protein
MRKVDEESFMKSTTYIPDREANGHSDTATSADPPSHASREIHDFLADVEDLIKATSSLTGEELARARAKLNQRVAAARESVEQISEKVTDQVRSTARTTDSYVRENPWQAVGIGAVLGLLLGLALTRRK